MSATDASVPGTSPREIVRARDGRVLGEIVENDGAWLVVRREPVRFPPRKRHTLLATFRTLDEARERAPDLLGAAGDDPARSV